MVQSYSPWGIEELDMAKRSKPRRIKKETTFGDEVVHGLTDFFDAVGRGETITVRTLKLDLSSGGVKILPHATMDSSGFGLPNAWSWGQ